MSTATITLAFPIEYKGETVSELSMRRPKLKDQLRSMTSGKSDAESEKDLFANLCEQSPDFMDELDLSDYKKLQNTFSGFLSSAKTQSES
ncbi:phage tail assembly protein [Pseudoalteromonas piscicida]|uniref:phage tail assembly protein n=1 Tax=Pseudoalteromonas piscicida TaxID=43662 RepID=UPI0030C92634